MSSWRSHLICVSRNAGIVCLAACLAGCVDDTVSPGCLPIDCSNVIHLTISLEALDSRPPGAIVVTVEGAEWSVRIECVDSKCTTGVDGAADTSVVSFYGGTIELQLFLRNRPDAKLVVSATKGQSPAATRTIEPVYELQSHCALICYHADERVEL